MTGAETSRFRNRFLNAVERLKKTLKAAGTRPTAEQTHRLRVSIRRVRAGIRLLRDAQDDPSVGRLNRHLKKVCDALGQQREIEIAIADARSYRIFSKKLSERLARARKEVVRALKKKRRVELLGELTRLERGFQSERWGLDPGVLNHLSSAWLDCVAAPRTPADYHLLRIATKKLRYAREMLGRPAEPLRELQDILGRAHDLHILQQFVGGNSEVKKAERRLYVDARGRTGKWRSRLGSNQRPSASEADTLSN